MKHFCLKPSRTRLPEGDIGCGTILKLFNDAVVTSATVTAVVSLGSGISAVGRKKFGQTHKEDQFCPGVHSALIRGVGREKAILLAIINNTSHPLHNTPRALSNTFSDRLLHWQYVKCHSTTVRFHNVHHSSTTTTQILIHQMITTLTLLPSLYQCRGNNYYIFRFSFWVIWYLFQILLICYNPWIYPHTGVKVFNLVFYCGTYESVGRSMSKVEANMSKFVYKLLILPRWITMDWNAQFAFNIIGCPQLILVSWGQRLYYVTDGLVPRGI